MHEMEKKSKWVIVTDRMERQEGGLQGVFSVLCIDYPGEWSPSLLTVGRKQERMDGSDRWPL